jgi:hypothetical protein
MNDVSVDETRSGDVCCCVVSKQADKRFQKVVSRCIVACMLLLFIL